MNRRKFIYSSGAGAAAAAVATLTGGALEPASLAAQSTKNVLMKVGANAIVSEEGLNAVLRYGIKNIAFTQPSTSSRLCATSLRKKG